LECFEIAKTPRTRSRNQLSARGGIGGHFDPALTQSPGFSPLWPTSAEAFAEADGVDYFDKQIRRFAPKLRKMSTKTSTCVVR